MTDKLAIVKLAGQRGGKSIFQREMTKAALAQGKSVFLLTRNGTFPVVGVVDDPNTRLIEGPTMPDANTSLLIWLERGTRTRDEARRLKKDQHAAWATSLDDGLFTIEKDGALLLTAKGIEELAVQRMMT